MSVPTTISIDGTDYVRKSDIPADTTPTDRQIVAADRGWVFVGDASWDGAGNVTLGNASVVRRWGTKKGLGELALGGATSTTVLDLCGTVRVPSGSVVAVFNVAVGAKL